MATSPVSPHMSSLFLFLCCKFSPHGLWNMASSKHVNLDIESLQFWSGKHAEKRASQFSSFGDRKFGWRGAFCVLRQFIVQSLRFAARTSSLPFCCQ